MSPNTPIAHLNAPSPVTRQMTLPPLGALLVLLALLALTAYGTMATVAPTVPTSSLARATPASAADTGADLALYKAIIRRVANSDNYYAAATSEQRLRSFPLHPFVTVRLPTLAIAIAGLGTTGSAALLAVLMLAADIAFMMRLTTELGPGRTTIFAGVLATIAIGPLAMSGLYWHEAWAAGLMTLSLALRSRDRWIASVVFGFAAVAVRELALPYLLVMLATAAFDRRRDEAWAWGCAVIASAIIIGLHAHLVSAMVLPSDAFSPGWSGFGGWRFLLRMAENFTSLSLLPAAVTSVFVPLALLGWIAFPGPFGMRGALIVCGYATGFMVFGRPDNDYWIVLISPLLPVGIALAPAALRALSLRVATRSRQPAPRSAERSA